MRQSFCRLQFRRWQQISEWACPLSTHVDLECASPVDLDGLVGARIGIDEIERASRHRGGARDDDLPLPAEFETSLRMRRTSASVASPFAAAESSSECIAAQCV